MLCWCFWNGTGGQSRHPPTHTCLTALFPGLPRWAGTRKGKPIWILLKHETVSGSGISWNICKSAPRSRQITTPTPHHSVFYSSAGPFVISLFLFVKIDLATDSGSEYDRDKKKIGFHFFLHVYAVC